MKVKVFNKFPTLILVFVIINILFTVSCRPNPMPLDEISVDLEADVKVSDNTELLLSHKDTSADEKIEEFSTPLKNELEGLKYVLTPYLSSDNVFFVGSENKDFIENYFLNPDDTNLSISTADWKRIVKILLVFDDKYNSSLTKYISNFAADEKIERQYAVSGLMNLLSIRYSLPLEIESEDMQKSNIINDLDDVDEKHKSLICKAFRLGFTDFTVEEYRLFRPSVYLSRGEAISMFYRIFSNLGLPINEHSDTLYYETGPCVHEEVSTPDQSHEAYSIENIYNEYQDYKSSLEKSKSSANRKRVEMLNLAEEILRTHTDSQISKDTLSIDEWIDILDQVFEIDSDKVKALIPCQTDRALTFDIVAISIFEFSYLMGGDKPRDATAQEIDLARQAIHQFDTSEDISKFVQLFSSGMLEGIFELPGFTPKRPVNNSEAMLLIMRIVKGLSI